MKLVERSVRGITRGVGPTRVGYLLAHWAVKHYGREWPADQRDVVAEHWDRGLRMRVDPTHHVGGAIYWRGFHSRRLLCCLNKILRPDMTVFDVGANQGEISLYVARRVPKGRVFAFEPVDDNYRRLANNVQLNGLTNITIKKCCLGDHAGKTQLFATSDESNLHRHGYHEGLSSMFASSDAIPAGHAEVQRLDDVASSHDLSRLDVIKIDVEGAELSVIRGASESIKRFRPSIIVEMNEQTFGCAGYTPAELDAVLRESDYECFVICRSGCSKKTNGRKMPRLWDALYIHRSKSVAAF